MLGDEGRYLAKQKVELKHCLNQIGIQTFVQCFLIG